MSDGKFRGKSIVNLRLLRKIGIIGLSVSAATIVLVAVFSLLTSSGKSFTIRLDNPIEAPHIQMSSSVNGGDPSTYFVGDPILNASQALGPQVYERVNAIDSLDYLHGSQNLDHMEQDGTINPEGQDAQVYTLYLTATGDEEEVFQVTLNLDGLDVPFGVTSPLEYYRAMFITSDVTESLESHVNQNVTVYGNKTNTNQSTVLDENDMREAVSSFSRVRNNDGRTVRQANEDSKIAGQAYCEPFASNEVGEQLVRFQITIPSKETKRITFVGYFEGYDPDGYGLAPTEAYMLLSLHFGK